MAQIHAIHLSQEGDNTKVDIPFQKPMLKRPRYFPNTNSLILPPCSTPQLLTDLMISVRLRTAGTRTCPVRTPPVREIRESSMLLFFLRATK